MMMMMIIIIIIIIIIVMLLERLIIHKYIEADLVILKWWKKKITSIFIL
jgi:hypothetical protein